MWMYFSLAVSTPGPQLRLSPKALVPYFMKDFRQGKPVKMA